MMLDEDDHDGDDDNGDDGDMEDDDDDSGGNDDGVWLKLAMIILMFKTLENGVYAIDYGDDNDVDTGSVLVTLIMVIMFLIRTMMFL